MQIYLNKIKIRQNKMERKGTNIKVQILEKNYREF